MSSPEDRRLYDAPHLAANAENFAALTPLSLLARAARTYHDKLDALRRRGIGRGDTVAVLAPNVPALLEAHYGVPMAGAVLNALNHHLDARAIAFILAHGEAKLLIADRAFGPTGAAAREALASPPPL